jgi:hypothetical protein
MVALCTQLLNRSAIRAFAQKEALIEESWTLNSYKELQA